MARSTVDRLLSDFGTTGQPVRHPADLGRFAGQGGGSVVYDMGGHHDPVGLLGRLASSHPSLSIALYVPASSPDIANLSRVTCSPRVRSCFQDVTREGVSVARDLVEWVVWDEARARLLRAIDTCFVFGGPPAARDFVGLAIGHLFRRTPLTVRAIAHERGASVRTLQRHFAEVGLPAPSVVLDWTMVVAISTIAVIEGRSLTSIGLRFGIAPNQQSRLKRRTIGPEWAGRQEPAKVAEAARRGFRHVVGES